MGFAGRPAVTIKNPELSESQQLLLDWWTDFREALISRTDLTSAQQLHPRSGYNVPLGRSGIKIMCWASTSDNTLAVRIYMETKYNSESALSQLMAQKDDIEAEIGESLLWDALPDATDKVIAITREGDLSVKAKWSEYLDWMINMTEKFNTVFRPRVLELDLTAMPEDDDEVS